MITKQERKRLKNARQKEKRQLKDEDLFFPPRVPKEMENSSFQITKGMFMGVYSGKFINDLNDQLEETLKARANETNNNR